MRFIHWIKYQLLKYKLLDFSRLTTFGWEVRLEGSSKCQLKCPLCLTGIGKHRNETVVGWGHLKFADFKQFVDKHPYIRAIELSNYGEIFLNPEIKDILAYAYQQNVTLTAGNGVNLNNIKEDVIEALVKYRFGRMKVSIDGASEETYQIYRVGGSFEQVIRHIRRINYYKQYYGSKYPKMKWQFIIFGHNEQELPKARQMAAELGMSFKPKLNYKTKKYAVKDKDYVAQESGLGVATVEDYEKQRNHLYSPACLQLWTSPQINWDGRLLGCCVNFFGDFGNVFEQGLDKCLQGERYQYAKQMVLGEKPARDDIPCTRCKRYQRVKQMPFRESLLQEFKNSSKHKSL